MIPPLRIPIMPLPPREFFKSDEAYLAAKNSHMKQESERREEEKTQEAILIIFGCLMFLLGLFALSMPLYFTFGWRGPLAIPFIGGLFWVVFYQVRSRL